VLFRAEKMLDIYRILSLQSDLGFQLTLGNVKEGWNLAEKIKTSGAQVFLSLDLPEDKKDDDKDKKEDAKLGDKKDMKKDSTKKEPVKKDPPKVKTTFDIERETLEKRKAEFIAKYASVASLYQKAGIRFGFSSLGAKVKDIPANLRKIIAAGLSEDQALAALTTVPAQLLGLSDRLGTVDNGKIANLVVTDKPYFNEKAKVRYVFVEGELYKLDAKEVKKDKLNSKIEIAGSWTFSTETPQGKNDNKVIFKKSGNGYNGTVAGNYISQTTEAKDIDISGDHLKFTFTISIEGNSIAVTVEGTVDGDTFKGTSTAGSFGSFTTEGSKNPQ
jgi:Amidohydrolase family